MRHILGLTCAAAIGAVAVGAAQTPGTSTSTQAKGKTITVSGCVQRAADTGATGTTGTTGMAPKFELTNAMLAGSSTRDTMGTSGAAAKTFTLDGTDAQLSAHINHKVEVTGTVEESAMGSTHETTGTTGAAKAPKLKVDSVKMVSATCP